MGKSSSSLKKKKRAKVSSQDRKTKSKSLSKSSKYRSKKVRRRDDSDSSSDDDSRSLQSVSSFSSEDDSRSRRAWSRARRDVKGSKKRSRRRSYSCDSSEDSPCGKTRKASKKKKDYEPRKKLHSRKKPKRNVSVSSLSSASVRCSISPSGSISGDEVGSKRHKVRPGKRSRGESDANKVESRTKRGRYRSRSCSLQSQGSESNDLQGEEKVVSENSKRRLRSVIVLTEEYNLDRWVDNDSNKEEITYDNDECPSCRSNGSNDGGRKRDLDDHLHVALAKRIGVENAEKEEAVVSSVPIRNFRGSDNGFEKDHEVQVKGSNSSCGAVGAGVHLKENKNEVSGAITSQAGEDLESILRQRALENLKRFKGRVTTNQKDKSDNDLKQSSTPKAELALKEIGATVVAAKSSKEDVAEMVGASQLVEEANGPPVTNSILPSEIEKSLDRTNVGNEIIAANQDVASPTSQVAVGNSNKKVDTTSVLNKPNLASPFRRHSLKSHWTLTQASSAQQPHAKLLPTKSGIDKSVSRTAQTVTQSSSSNCDESAPGAAQTTNQSSTANGDKSAPGTVQAVTESSNGEDIGTGLGSFAPEPSGETRSDSQGEAKDGSQYEQKTMNVMRGGELVQLSYKVYIPKRSPALARRQLRR